MITRVVALLCTFLVLACYSPSRPPYERPAPLGSISYEVWLDPAFTESEADLIVSALDEWRSVDESFGYHVEVVSTDETVISHTIKLRKHDLTTAGEYGHAYWTDDKGCLVLLDPKLGSNWAVFRMVALHEFGHCFHLPHYMETRTIMYPSVSGMSAEITEYDRMTFRNVN